MDGFLAQIMMFAGDFAPRGWAFCHGQLLPISQHVELFAVLGARYGGDGKATFALPDLRGRIPVGSTRAGRRSRGSAPARLVDMDFVICIEGGFPQRP